ncbi:uncharacterized protein MONOS_9991 [Monocercomonoides exilis]|uniref:uncharacterized protein n=1 Tax=Monocercomonoides exilis TaxID=2049356 RepID=UPI0035596E0D|nr:hypothetical protein MONOS_9991 [Monocercomonoides exilis]|eukprot:MONOS_9991.1-p1 / transcript=MONOS_9991.1 / gene=MONOS_9991 / organism=Monocercomonoides_exilis_PA203 / gene_product=unspecified product / transcript_product=unspecified product / location=Mono_scaffold00434:38214-39681(+) / protein_length=403 / sequence_SO=supercontig / SO=protein_coding / is_pseudo=false
MGPEISIPMSGGPTESSSSTTSKVSDEEVLEMFGIEDASLSPAKQKIIVDYLRNSAESLIHLSSTKSTDPISEALVKFMKLKTDDAEAAAEGVHQKLNEFGKSAKSDGEKADSSKHLPNATRSDLASMEKRLREYAKAKIEEVQDELSMLTKSVEEPWSFKEEDIDKESEDDDSDEKKEVLSEDKKDEDSSESSDKDDDDDDDDDEDKSDSSSSSSEKKKEKKGKSGTFTLPVGETAVTLDKKGTKATWTMNKGVNMLVNPIIKTGIYKCEMQLKNTDCISYVTGIGLVQAPYTKNSTYLLGSDEQSLFYNVIGYLNHNSKRTNEQLRSQDGDVIGIEVNMKKKTVHFFSKKSQLDAFYTKIPKSVQILGRCYKIGSELTIVKFKKISKATVKEKKSKTKLVW